MSAGDLLTTVKGKSKERGFKMTPMYNRDQIIADTI